MNQYGSYQRCYHIKPNVGSQQPNSGFPITAIKKNRNCYQNESDGDRPENHLSRIELYLFLVAGADAGDDDQQERGNLTIGEVTGLVNQPTLL